MFNSPLVSVCIPAYNQQYLLDRLVISIKEQIYRPIEVVIVDDNSPTPIKIDESLIDEGLQIKVTRNDQSLGPYWNMLKSISIAQGKYVYQIDHDDYLIDNTFIKSAVSIFEDNSNAQIVVANSEIENLSRTTFEQSNESSFHRFDGLFFLRKHLFGNIHPARSGYIMNYQSLKKVQFQNVFYSPDYFNSEEVYPDESFSLPTILCSLGEVFVSHRVVSVRGNPKDSFSKSNFWRENSGISVLVQHIRLTEFLFVQGKYRAASIILLKSIFGRKHSPAIRVNNLGILKKRGITNRIRFFVVLNFLVHFPYFSARTMFYSFRYRVLHR